MGGAAAPPYLEMSVEQTIYLFERGILGWQSIFGDWKNWPNQAVTEVNKNTPHKAQTLTYFTGPILAGITRGFRARQFAKMIEQYRGKGWRIVMVAHSEGTATGLRALNWANWPRVEEIHLVCGACDSDFAANGLNQACETNRVGRVFVYVAGRDAAMKLEDTYIGSACFGLQTGGTPLGLRGPTNMSPTAERRTSVIQWSAYSHSECWEPRNFQGTMHRILNPSPMEVRHA